MGDFTNEIDKKDGNHIIEFVSAGPKNYSYRLDTNKTKCVVKGFSLNNNTTQQVNFDTIKNIVNNNRNEKIRVNQLKFSRNKETWEVYSEWIEKLYGFVYDKRVLKEDFTTRPYGY